MKTIIIGAGDLGQQVLRLCKTCEWEVKGFVDDFRTEAINGIPILCSLETFMKNQDKYFEYSLVLAIGYKHLQQKSEIVSKLSDRLHFPNLIHPSTILDSHSLLGKGNIIFHGTIITDASQVGNFNILYNQTNISHDSLIGSYNSFSPGVQISGKTKIGDFNFFGTGSILIDNLTIGNANHFAAGAIVINNIENNGKYKGTPAKVYL